MFLIKSVYFREVKNFVLREDDVFLIIHSDLFLRKSNFQQCLTLISRVLTAFDNFSKLKIGSEAIEEFFFEKIYFSESAESKDLFSQILVKIRLFGMGIQLFSYFWNELIIILLWNVLCQPTYHLLCHYLKKQNKVRSKLNYTLNTASIKASLCNK